MHEAIKNKRAKPGQSTKFTAKERAGITADPKREKRLEYLIKAFVHFDDDMELLLSELDPDDLDKLIAEDPWFGRQFDRPASALMEESVLLNLMSMTLAKNAQTLPSAKVVLPALNRRRYNLGVQKQEVANEGMRDFIEATTRPMSRAQVIEVLTLHDPKLIEHKAEAMKVLTLDEAVEIEKERGTFVENRAIQEDDDLK